MPVFLFSVLFALSMDYHVFLITRIRERYVQSGDTVDAVVHGIASTGRIITGAALIIVAVFAGFAAGDLVMFQQMGFGVGVALLIDATIIRMIVVPASMTVLGRWNWYLPSWLDWLPELHVEGDPDAHPQGTAQPPQVITLPQQQVDGQPRSRPGSRAASLRRGIGSRVGAGRTRMPGCTSTSSPRPRPTTRRSVTSSAPRSTPNRRSRTWST